MTYHPQQRSRIPGAALAVDGVAPALRSYLEAMERGLVDHIQPNDQPDSFLSRERYRYAPLVLGPGVWNVNAMLDLAADDIHIVGSGYHTVLVSKTNPIIGITGTRVTLENLRLVYTGTATSGFMLGVVATSPVIRNVWLDGNASAQIGGMSLVSSDWMCVEGCRSRLVGGRSATPMIWCDNSDKGLILGNVMEPGAGATYFMNINNGVGACNTLSITGNVSDPAMNIRYNAAGNHVLAGNVATALPY